MVDRRRADPRRDRAERRPGPRPGGLDAMDVLILAVAFVIILLGAELFTNGIEWFGRKLELAEGAVGSVLAAVGTALPETMIPIIAILSGGGLRGVARRRRRGDPRRAVHALDAGDVRDRRRGPVQVGASGRPRRRDAGRHGGPRPRRPLLRDRLRDRDRRRVPAARAGLAEVDRGGRPDRDLRVVREGPLRGRSRRRRRGPGAAPLPAPRSPRARRRIRMRRGSGWSTSRSSPPSR